MNIRQIAYKSVFSSFANIWGAGLNYVILIVAANHLTSLNFWSVISSFVMIFGVVSTSISHHLSQNIAQVYKSKKSIDSTYFKAIKKIFYKKIPYILCSIILILPLVYLTAKESIAIVFLLGVNFFIQIFVDLHLSNLVGKLDTKNVTKNIFILHTSRFIFTFFFLSVLNLGVSSLVLGSFGALIISFWFLFSQNYTELKPQETLSEAIKINPTSLINTVLGSLIVYSFLHFPIILSSVIFNSLEADKIVIFLAIAQMIFFGISSFFNFVIPTIIHHIEKAKVIFLSMIGFIIILGSIGTLFIYYFNNIILNIFNRDEYAQYSNLMFYVGGFATAFTILFFTYQVLIATKGQKYVFLLIPLIIANFYYLKNSNSVDNTFNNMFIFTCASCLLLLSAFIVNIKYYGSNSNQTKNTHQ